MIYYLFDLLRDYDLPGGRLMTYLTFRSGCAFMLALLIALFIGRKIITRLQLMQVGEIIRDLGLEGQMKKTGTPTMGGIIIILSILVPCLLVGNLANIYMILMIVSTVWLGMIGFLDDYIKVAKHDKEGMKGKFKIIGQVGLGLIVGATMYLSPQITMRENVEEVSDIDGQVTVTYVPEDIKSTQTTIPFVKNHNFDYAWLTGWMGEYRQAGGWALFILVVILAVAATSNGANLTDGLDGLCAGTSAIICVALAVMAYLGGNIIYSQYLNIMYIPGSGELVVYMAAMIGALIGFLWYNAYPAQVFMGDTGSLTLGGIIAVFAILIHKELLIPLLCAIFFVEDLSVILQVSYFKFTKKRFGEGRRIFKMTPLHHHFQKEGIAALVQRPFRAIAEPKIVTRFWIIGILLAAITFVTLKIR
ncbi:MAG: phospho-N-acetylmuramoyl-pentapeptide-transferase [Bacteroides sp.]|nr:phospho-N-acetylmuramoyl-pentapeptide-transferase [Bacteroidales bacterium]MBD5249708.1 phospho-N-acetylmuramoyl-pentapeptide-transferase [Barnesiella sp.]MBD5345109.1 phospho-N-acetylmuramoyl-pentapeptide-transferase [Bacteroides sp.]MBD5368356.1 phospho-N-acetylmuramoyl-pentapeptide-transferase [Bacteroides sp.]MDE5828682.1 phospho-N-acetylmuramoyl-pentapeptide-transferase [Duncaniella sp.]